MSKALLLLASLAAVASASASLEVYFTNAADGYGLSNPALAFTVTGGDGYDGYNYLLADKDGSGDLSAGDVPPVPVGDIAVDPGDTVYVWLKFVDEPNGRKIAGLSFKCNEVIPETMAFYKADSTAIGTGKRWQSTLQQLSGTLPIDPNKPLSGPGKIYMLALTVNGIVNRTNTYPQDLYYGDGSAATGTRVALLGALRIGGPIAHPCVFTFGFADPVNTVEYAGDYPNPVVHFAALRAPEPSAMLLALLAAVLFGRRLALGRRETPAAATAGGTPALPSRFRNGSL